MGYEVFSTRYFTYIHIHYIHYTYIRICSLRIQAINISNQLYIRLEKHRIQKKTPFSRFPLRQAILK